MASGRLSEDTVYRRRKMGIPLAAARLQGLARHCTWCRHHDGTTCALGYWEQGEPSNLVAFAADCADYKRGGK